MLLGRRAFLAATAAAGLAAGLPALASVGERRFALYRGDNPIGAQTITVRRDGGSVTVNVDVDIAVRILGITAYRYTLRSEELWENGALASLDSRTNDNGTPHFARATRDGDALVVEGSEFTGRVTGRPATTTYWSPAFLERSVWISTQDGRPFRVDTAQAGTARYPTAAGEVTATRWRVGGELPGLDLFYDAAGEWVGSEFDAQGETARFVMEARGAPLSPLWVGS
jgi:hypothetical protein